MNKSYAEMVQESYKRNLNRVVQALKKLERANEGACIGCNEKVYRDGCVVLREGSWIEPDSFHKSDCHVSRVMYEVVQEVVPEEIEMAAQHRKEFWNSPGNKAFREEVKASHEKLLIEIEESETSKFN